MSKVEHFYQTIPGWFDFGKIYREAVERASDCDIFVEVGAWQGRSTAFMVVEIANSNKSISFYTVDTWEGAEDSPHQLKFAREHGDNIFPLFCKNLGELLSLVRPIQRPSQHAAAAFDDRSLSFVFIDACHNYCDISRDIEVWLPKVKPGGVIAGHDVDRPGVSKAVREHLSDTQIEGNSWIAQLPLDD